MNVIRRLVPPPQHQSSDHELAMAGYWWMVAGTAGRGAGAAVTRRARAARVPVRASSMATDRKIRPSVRAPTVIWLVMIQWPSWGPEHVGRAVGEVDPGAHDGDPDQRVGQARPGPGLAGLLVAEDAHQRRGEHAQGQPGRRRGDFQQQALTRCGDALEEEGHDDGLARMKALLDTGSTYRRWATAVAFMGSR